MVLAIVLSGCTNANVPPRGAHDATPEPQPFGEEHDDDPDEGGYELYFERVPAQLSVGESIQLSVTALDAGEPIDVGQLAFESRTPEVLTVDAAGQARAVAAGTAYLKAHNARGMALAEIEVVEP